MKSKCGRLGLALPEITVAVVICILLTVVAYALFFSPEEIKPAVTPAVQKSAGNPEKNDVERGSFKMHSEAAVEDSDAQAVDVDKIDEKCKTKDAKDAKESKDDEEGEEFEDDDYVEY